MHPSQLIRGREYKDGLICSESPLRAAVLHVLLAGPSANKHNSQGALFRKLLPVTDLNFAQFRSTDTLLNLSSQFRSLAVKTKELSQVVTELNFRVVNKEH